ncbi:uncharacterized protein LOC142645095 [Dermatophagoides pteronyssinus]|uniref:uncharacterized protein LOC142645095 n=1 Tax=Dermatophagoides pteronyssinus TaxID=6956 RepID=UPI003F67B79D
MEQQQKPITDDDSIQLIVKIFGISGVQLRRWNPKNRWILLNWWMNILLNVWFYYVIFINKSYYVSMIISQLESSDQYLLSYIYIANHYLIFVIIYTGFMVWFIRYGHEMIEYLRSPIFKARCSFIKMVSILALSLIYSIMILMWNWIFATLQLISSTQYFNTVAMLAMFIFQNYLIVSWLKLSNFNDPIRKRFSWMLIIQLLDNLSYFIADITYMISLGLDSLFGTVLALPLRLILWLKLCQMNNKILEQFDRIEYRLDRQIRKYQLNNHNNNNLDDNTLNILIKMKQIHRFAIHFVYEYMLMQFNKFNAYILFPLIYYAYTLSYFINGHRLIECFQSTIYLSIQYSKQKSILILSIVMIIQNFIVQTNN